MGLESAVVSEYAKLQKLKKSLPEKIKDLAEKKKCKSISQLGVVIKQLRDQKIQSHKPKKEIDGVERPKENKKKIKVPLPHIGSDYANKIMEKSKNLKII